MVDPIADREQLVAALKDAADIEHQLMVQYLYTAFSLKRDPDSSCSPAQYEAVRRWSSTLFMIARQEMEHLSLANGMLTAIGAQPHFHRERFGKAGLQSPYFTSAALAIDATPDAPKPVPLPYAFQRFERATVERYVCAESPPYADLPHDIDPAWCFTCGQETAAEELPRARSWLGIEAGSVQELYTRIRNAFEELDGLFVPSPPEVTIPVEYDVFVFPVVDRQSAVGAIDLILEQGEGLGDPWNLDSHFRRFYEMRGELVEMQDLDPGFDPAYPLLTNPERSAITDELARAVFDVSNRAYTVLLLLLASLYQRAAPPGGSYPHLSDALKQNAFAPAMTMIVRAINEVPVRHPIDAEGARRTGSSYEIAAEDAPMLEHPEDARLGDIAFLLERWDGLTEALRGLAGSSDDLAYVHQSAHRIGANLRHTYQSGVYPKFVSV